MREDMIRDKYVGCLPLILSVLFTSKYYIHMSMYTIQIHTNTHTRRCISQYRMTSYSIGNRVLYSLVLFSSIQKTDFQVLIVTYIQIL